ncbi:MAG: hypothetical protein U0326_01645 [Polyangiales bacterium]
MVDDARTQISFNASKEAPMSSQGRPSFAKRQKEQARAEKQREKAAERARRAVDRKNKPEGEPGVDPDIAGVIPGPQPVVED